jgi:HTH-type transcriptional regulator/antitoxin HigA
MRSEQMPSRSGYEYSADYAIPPGETLRETIETLDLSQTEVARRTGLSLKHLNQIVQGNAPISHETALALERVTGVPARFWDSLEANYQRRLLRAEETAGLSGQELEAWIRSLPVRELARRNLIEDSSHRGLLVQQLLAFFGVATVDAWHDVWGSRKLALLRAPSNREPKPEPLAAWLREGELEARRIRITEPFDSMQFEATFDQIRSATRNPRTAVGEVQRLCSEVGIAFVVVHAYEEAPVSGAARWLTPSKPLIQLSLRYRRDDHFWLSFFHEAAHILRHPKKSVYVDDIPEQMEPDTDSIEEEANEFAARVLIPSAYDEQLSRLKTVVDVIDFAEEIGIAPGVVVGQLQFRDLHSWKWGNNLRAIVRLPRSARRS